MFEEKALPRGAPLEPPVTPAPPAPRAPPLLQRELELSGKIQETLLLGKPPPPDETLDVGVLCRPAGHVGGDFTEFFRYGPSVQDVVVGDVMGKGFPAALVGAALKAQILRHSRGQRAGEEHRPEGTPSWILERVHQGVVPDLQELGYFATMVYARLDLRRRLLSYVDCGHAAVLHYRALERDVVELAKCGEALTNMPLGMQGDPSYRTLTLSFSPGDIFLLYTDGLSEALGERVESRGRARLREMLTEQAQRPMGELVERLVHPALEAVGDEAPDDITCVALRPGVARP